MSASVVQRNRWLEEARKAEPFVGCNMIHVFIITAMIAAGGGRRVPLLAPMFVGLAAVIRRKRPDHTHGPKVHFREVLVGVLAKDVLTRPKRGFTPPVSEWFRAIVTHYNALLAKGLLVAAVLIDPAGTTVMVKCAPGCSRVDLFMAYKLTLLDAWYSGVASCSHR